MEGCAHMRRVREKKRRKFAIRTFAYTYLSIYVFCIMLRWRWRRWWCVAHSFFACSLTMPIPLSLVHARNPLVVASSLSFPYVCMFFFVYFFYLLLFRIFAIVIATKCCVLLLLRAQTPACSTHTHTHTHSFQSIQHYNNTTSKLKPPTYILTPRCVVVVVVGTKRRRERFHALRNG